MKNIKFLKDKFINSLNNHDNYKFFGISSSVKIDGTESSLFKNQKTNEIGDEIFIKSKIKYKDDDDSKIKNWMISYKQRFKLNFDLFILFMSFKSCNYILYS